MDRTYLYVAPQEYPEVKASGALWDEQSKRWYLPDGMAPRQLSKWLDEPDEAEFGISCDQAHVASAQLACIQCERPIEVITIYCESGVDAETGDAIADVTVSSIWAMDQELSVQLEPWPFFRMVSGNELESGCYANHCPHCRAVQAEYLLHDEPGDVFFGFLQEQKSMQFTRLVGKVRMSGDYEFGV
jgi:hypothetical protein